MLVRVRRLLINHRQALLTHWLWWCRTPWTTGLTILVLSVVLVLPLLLWIGSQAMQGLTAGWGANQRIALYLQNNLTATQMEAFLMRVRAMNGVSQAQLITPDQGLAFLQQDPMVAESLAYLPNNPLPAMLEIWPDMTSISVESVQVLFDQLQSQPEVDLAQFDLQWMLRLHTLMQFIQVLTCAAMVLLACAVIIIIGNTLQLLVHKQQDELQVLKLIGASDAFIMRPFLYAGLGYGLCGALGALGIMQLWFVVLDAPLKSLFALLSSPYTGIPFAPLDVAALLGCASLLGWFAACVSVKRRLAFVEPVM